VHVLVLTTERPKYICSVWNYASPFSVWSTVFRIAAFISWFKFAV